MSSTTNEILKGVDLISLSEKKKQAEFDIVKEELRIANGETWSHYRKYQKWKYKQTTLQIDLENLCDHKWEIDRSNYSPGGTRYKCDSCNSSR